MDNSEFTTDPMAFMKNLMDNMAMPFAGMAALTLDEEALNKQIDDMKTVENWMRMNLSMLQTSIQALEIQKNTLSTMKSTSDEFSNMGKNTTSAEDETQPAQDTKKTPSGRSVKSSAKKSTSATSRR